jgi:N-acetylglucosamine kinase-like BadF-type ATPase
VKYILGVDAGNTKTIALVAHLDGKIVGYGRGGCGDIYNAGSPEIALKHIAEAVTSALRAANIGTQDLVSAAFSMAGADWPEDFSYLERALTQTYRAKYVTVVNDSVGALRAGAVDNWGVAIANGTGAGVSARSQDGQLWHSSFWQEGGGAREIGLNALKAVYKSELGIIAKTGLTARVLAFYKLDSVEELLYQFTKRGGARLTNSSGLARTVLDLAEEGDAVAGQIVQAEGTTLGDYALAAARKVGIVNQLFPLVLAGSVFKHKSPILTNAILDRVRRECPGVTVLRSELEPSAGALVIAREASGHKVGPRMRARLKKTAPPSEFFAT